MVQGHGQIAGVNHLQLSQPCQEVLDYVESSFYRRKKVIAVSLDCTGAFDCVGFDAASEALITKEAPSRDDFVVH